MSVLDLASAPELPLFYNSSISRRLPVDAIKEVLEDLTGRGNFEWTDKSKRRGLVYWKSPQQTGQEIYKLIFQRFYKKFKQVFSAGYLIQARLGVS